ncbi:AraC family transcriptional regulator [Motilimonas pumila]|uniref:AraC family transcriptional regulator n=1 Tax=Motilimonas pumila TaxID=2303987 RepID=A0A418Y9T7_9GAMM|nr:AraC family transcriptional regulator [Motilimonas pumila]RJG38276.1 AraC family transcriptional regulator [Motilimonas pumila]
MKPFIEKVSREQNFKWHLLQSYQCNCQFEWHYHLEYEVVLLRNNLGQLFVADYIGEYGHNTLAMFGPRLPHTSAMHQDIEQHHGVSIVLWFSHQWVSELIATMPALSSLQTLLRRASQGILFPVETAEAMFQILNGFNELPSIEQASRFVQALATLAQSQKQTLLTSAKPVDLELLSHEQDKVEKATAYIAQHYQQPLPIEALGQHLHSSTSSVQRLFEKHFNESFSTHLKQYRIGKACELLLNTELAIAIIAEKVGFGNLSNFNRQFKQCKHMTPRQFRTRFEQAHATTQPS